MRRTSVKRTERRLQIIVLEHADEETWQGLAHVSLTERWRDNEYLVPLTWLTEEEKAIVKGASK
jgi:hypothetical protein